MLDYLLFDTFLTYKITTWPSEHSTPNQEQGSISPSFSIQFDKAPCGSLSTISLNLNKAKPAPFSNTITFLYKRTPTLTKL